MTRHCANPLCAGLIRDRVVPEYVDEIGSCLDCGRPTTPGVSPTTQGSADELEFNDLVTIFIASGIIQGEIVAALLDAAGIPVCVKGASLQGAMGELPADVVQVELQVPRERTEEARELTARWENPEAHHEDDGVFESRGEVDEIASTVRRVLRGVGEKD